MPEIVSLREAAMRGLRFFCAATSCSKGHVAKRYVSSGRCVVCIGIAEKKGNYFARACPRLEARMAGRTRYVGKICSKGHEGERFVKDGECVQCRRIKDKIRRRLEGPLNREVMRSRRKRARNIALGLRGDGKPRIRPLGQSLSEKRERARELKLKHRLAYIALKELGIEV